MRSFLRRLRNREVVTTAADVVGAATVSIGVGMVYVPAGVIAAGLAVLGLSYASAGGDS